MDNLKTLINDFSVLFSYLWRKDFPMGSRHRETASRSDWTNHIGMTFKGCADLMGFFTYFEAGGRTDAIIKNNDNEELVFSEWEWITPEDNYINEFKKLRKKANNKNHKHLKFCFLFIYYSHEKENKLIDLLKKEWSLDSIPLLVAVLYYEGNSYREFKNLSFYAVEKNKIKKIREQPALPEDIAGTRWENKD